MQQGEKIRYFRKKKGVTQIELAKTAGLTQGNISDIERGRQSVSLEFIRKISGVLGLSVNDIVDILGIVAGKESNELWPAEIGENHKERYEISFMNRERRLPEDAPKRKLVDNFLKILDSGNKKVVRALKSNIDAFLFAIEKRGVETKGSD